MDPRQLGVNWGNKLDVRSPVITSRSESGGHEMERKRSEAPLTRKQRQQLKFLTRKAEVRLKAKLNKGAPRVAISGLVQSGGEPVNGAARAGTTSRLRPR